jgi:DNA-binding beta-propeller fold protein YncE
MKKLAFSRFFAATLFCVAGLLNIGLAQTYTVTSFAGTLGVAGNCQEGVPATDAKLSAPEAVATDHTTGMLRSGNLYIADRNNKRIRAVNNQTGKVATFAGNGKPWNGAKNCGDGGLAVNGQFADPVAVAVDNNNGNVYIADLGAGNIRFVDAFGFIWTVAEHVSNPIGLATDRNGNLFVAQREPFFIIKYSPTISKSLSASAPVPPVAGKAFLPLNYAGSLITGNSACYKSPTGLAYNANLRYLAGIAVDSAKGYLYIADEFQNRILRVDNSDDPQNRKIVIVAGNGDGAERCSGNFTEGTGNAVNYSINKPSGIAVDNNSGAVFFTDADNQRVRKLTPNADYSAYTMTTVAGNPSEKDGGTTGIGANSVRQPSRVFMGGAEGDGGSALTAHFNFGYSNRHLAGIAVDNFGNVYIADRNNNAVRRLKPANENTETLIAAPPTETATLADVKVFPNPALTNLTFEFSAKCTAVIRLSDMAGKLLLSQQVGNQSTATVYVGNFTPGVYFFEVESGSMKKSGKIVVQ